MSGSSSSSSGFFKSILGWLPNWVGFGVIIVVGVLAIIFGFAGGSAGLVAFGVAAIISAIVAWVNGGKSTPQADPFKKSFGATVDNIDGWAWLAVFACFLVAVIIAVVAK